MNEELERITLEDEEGNAHDFEVYDVVEIDDTRYALLIPADPEEDEEETAYLFRFDVDEDGEEVLTSVEDDDEWDRVEAFLEERDASFADDGDYEYGEDDEDES